MEYTPKSDTDYLRKELAKLQTIVYTFIGIIVIPVLGAIVANVIKK